MKYILLLLLLFSNLSFSEVNLDENVGPSSKVIYANESVKIDDNFPNKIRFNNKRMTLIPFSDRAAKAKIDLIRNETKSIKMTIYAIAEDDTGLAYLELLREKARSGVKVEIIYDSYASKLSDSLKQVLIKDGIVLKSFNKVKITNPLKIDLRKHDKIMILESQKAVVLGDRNWKTPYFNWKNKAGSQSVDAVIVDDDLYRETVKYFDDLSSSKRVTKIKATADNFFNKAKRGVKRAKLKAAKITFLNEFMSRSVKSYNWFNHSFPVDDIKVVTDKINVKDKVKNGHHKDIIKLIDEAKDSLKFVNAYVVMPDDIMEAVERATKRGVKVQLITNSLASNDEKIVSVAAKDDYKKLLAMGAEVFEFEGPEFIHAKMIRVDDTISYVGSYNLDGISRYKNLESGFVVKSSRAAKLLDMFSDFLISRSNKVTDVAKLPKSYKCFPLPVILGRIKGFRKHL